MIALRQYQTDCVESVSKGWAEFRKQLAVLPTGAGKTICFSHVANRTQGRTLILAHREELIDQAIAKLHSATGIVASKDKAEDRGDLRAKVVVASIQTLMRETRLNRWPSNHFELVVADEAHHSISDSWLKVLHHFERSKILGVTATSDRGDARNLGTFYENVAFEISLFDLIRQGYLSPIAVKSVPLRIDLSSVGSTAGDFASDELGNAIEPYLEQIVAAIGKEAGFRRTLAFLPLIATSRKFVDTCCKQGLRAAHVDGESPDRKEILDRFAAGEFDILSNAMLLTEGYDVDSAPTGIGIDCVVMLRPTRSRPLYAQCVGRGTRIAPLKQNLLLLDFLWMHQRHRICRPASLIAKTDEEADAITALSEEKAVMPSDIAEQIPLDLQDLASSASSQREEALRKKLAEAAKNKSVFISAEEFAIQHNNLAVAEYEPTMPWESEPATEKQLAWLKRAKIDPASVKGKGHASRLLGIHFSQPPRMASHNQRMVMRRAGCANWENATEREAMQFFNKQRGRHKEATLL